MEGLGWPPGEGDGPAKSSEECVSQADAWRRAAQGRAQPEGAPSLFEGKSFCCLLFISQSQDQHPGGTHYLKKTSGEAEKRILYPAGHHQRFLKISFDSNPMLPSYN